MRLHAAILNGPRGPFAVLRAQPGQEETPMSDQARRQVADCFKSRHGNMPVAFLANEPSGMRLIGYEDASGDLEQCFRDVVTPQTEWKEFDA